MTFWSILLFGRLWVSQGLEGISGVVVLPLTAIWSLGDQGNDCLQEYGLPGWLQTPCNRGLKTGALTSIRRKRVRQVAS